MVNKDKIAVFLLFFFLLFLIAISYSNTLYSPFILDDLSAFVKNRNLYLQDFSFESLAKLIDTRFGYARLIPIATFAFDHYIAQGKSIVPYHITNILIHLFTTISLVFFLSGLLRTKGAKGRGEFIRSGYFVLAVSGLWALSPLQTNAVTYLVQRMTSMAAMFYLAACAFYVYARLCRGKWQKAVLFFFFLFSVICAFFSKENSATLPVAIVMIEGMLITPDLGGRILKSSRWFHWVFILLVAIILFPIINNYVSNQVAGFYGRHFTASERMLTELRIIVFYLSLLLLPLPGRMNLEHDFLLSTSLFNPPTTLLSLLILIGLLGVGFSYIKKHPIISFGIFWFFLNLVIESSFIPLELIFEHRLYLPSVGFFLAFVAFLDVLLDKHAKGSHPEIKKIVFLFFIIFISVASILTSIRNNDWKDKITLYRDSMLKSHRKSRAVTNYAMALGKAGHYDECIKYGTLSQTLGEQGYEDYMNAATNTLSCLLLQEKYDEAIEKGELFRQQILQKNMEYIEAGAMNKYMFNLGRAYAEKGQYRKAYETFQISLFRDPTDFPTFLAINNTLLYAQKDEQGRKDLAIGEEIYEVPLYLARIAYKYRQYEWAARYLEDAGKLGAPREKTEPLREKLTATIEQNNVKARESNIGNNPTYRDNWRFRSYLKAVDFILAKYKPLQGPPVGWLLNRAEAIDPGNPFITVYRARWNMANSQIDKAIEILEQYRETDKNFVPVLELLGICYQRQKDYGKSVAVLEHVLKIYHGNANWTNFLSYIYKNEDRLNESERTPLDYYYYEKQ